MYECRCPNDGKKLARIARPPLPELRLDHLCVCGRKVKAKVLVEARTKRIVAEVRCACGMSMTRTLGYLVTVKCRKCKAVIQF
jgi:hypothetical protein